LSIVDSFIIRSKTRLAGSLTVDVMQSLVFFSYFISNIFVASLFEQASKMMFM